MKASPGTLFVLSGPSGVGKGTVLERLLKSFDRVEYSVSATTRPKRPGEVDGDDYFFISKERFFKMVEEGQFIEWAEVHNNYYGTPRSYVVDTLKEGKDIILEIDIQGARQVKKTLPGATFIFLMPPSLKELEKRLEKRGSEDPENKQLRLENAREEISDKLGYDYEVVNDQLDVAVEKLAAIIIAENCRIRRGDEIL